MNLVVDANVVFSSLIKNGKTADLLLNLSFSLYTPEFILQEVDNNKEEIIYKTKRSRSEFEEILALLKQIVTIVPEEEFLDYIESAREICPDSDDVMYFAL